MNAIEFNSENNAKQLALKIDLETKLPTLGDSEVDQITREFYIQKIKKLEKWLKDFETYNKSVEDAYDFLFNKTPRIRRRVTQDNVYANNKVLIYAPPQVGKTKEIISLVKKSISNGVSVLISCDNKEDQKQGNGDFDQRNT